MKKIVKLFFAINILFAVSCEVETLNIQEQKEANNFKKGEFNSSSGELIIYYPENTTENEKQQKRLEYNVTNFKKCECADENLELWTLTSNTGDINIEEKKQTASVDEEIEGADFNPILQVNEDSFASLDVSGVINNALPKIVSANTGVTVAVLDTGIDYNYSGFPSSFLYNSKDDSCVNGNSTEYFGWNFVDNNNNPFDDYPGKHGTIVTNIITSNLDSQNVPYQILPVKVANNNGNIKYFDALCGFQYAIKKQNVKVVNMSFGWYNEDHELLSRFIEAVKNDILVVTSAGNDAINNDVISHYPSSYTSENIIAVDGLEDMGLSYDSNGSGIINPELAGFSNYGINSVDLAAISENIPFQYNSQTFYLNGTSYSAAYASFFSAFNYQNGIDAPTLKNMIISNSLYSQNLQNIKHSRYIPNN